MPSPLALVSGIIAWKVIPAKLAIYILPYFHKLRWGLLGRPPPEKDTPLYKQHHRWMYAFVVFGYALYSFYSTATSIGPNYYELLGVSPVADEADLKAGFRAFARKYHPDRAGPQFERLFMEVRDAYEALKNPTTRFAYDRFGPDALRWKHCKTMQEYLTHGVFQSTAYYVISFCTLFFWSTVSSHNYSFWSFVLLAFTAAQEMLFILGPSVSEPSAAVFSSWLFTDPVSPSRVGLLGLIWPYRVAYQHIEFLKPLSYLLSSAIYQVAPNLFPTSVETWDKRTLASFLLTFNQDVKQADRQAYEAIQNELNACHGGVPGLSPSEIGLDDVTPRMPAEHVMKLLAEEMEDVLVENLLLAGQSEHMKKATDQAVRSRARLAESTRPQLERGDTIRPKGPIRRMAPRPLEKLPSIESPPKSAYIRGRSISLT